MEQALLETLTIPQLFKKFPTFYGTRTHSQEPATCLIFNHISSVYAPIPLLDVHFEYFPPIYV
jgi:hypothetical protein